MDSFEFNKMAGALLGTLVVCMGIGFVGEAIFYHPLTKAGYDLPTPKPASAAATAPAPEEPLPVLLSKANAQKGKDDTHVCQACHNFEKGAGAKIGPPLYGVVGRNIASVAGFDYSDALKKKGGDWTFDKLFDWIKDPKAFAPGTKMAFAGEDDPKKRADILLYLRSLSDHPVPLPPVPKTTPKPAATTAQASSPAAPAGGAGGGGANSFTAMVAAAPPSRGKTDAKVCEVCHNFEKGAGAKIGPPLYGVVGRKVASVAGFDYSDALKKIGGDWTIDKLNDWIKNPTAMAPGTKMTFAGEADEKRRAAIVAYLRTLSDHPAPLTTPAQGTPPRPGASQADSKK